MNSKSTYVQYSPVQFVFLNSKVNGAVYDGEQLPISTWTWPRTTYLRQRLAQIRAEEVREGTERED